MLSHITGYQPVVHTGDWRRGRAWQTGIHWSADDPNQCMRRVSHCSVRWSRMRATSISMFFSYWTLTDPKEPVGGMRVRVLKSSGPRPDHSNFNILVNLQLLQYFVCEFLGRAFTRIEVDVCSFRRFVRRTDAGEIWNFPFARPCVHTFRITCLAYL